MKINTSTVLKWATIVAIVNLVSLIVVYGLARFFSVYLHWLSPEIAARIFFHFPVWLLEVLVILVVIHALIGLVEAYRQRAKLQTLDRLVLALTQNSATEAGEGMCVLDAKYQVVYCNEIFCLPHDISPEKLKGKDLLAEFPIMVKLLYEGLLAKAVESKKAATVATMGMGRSSSKWANYQFISVLPVFGPQGNFLGCSIRVTDHTKQQEAELRAEQGHRNFKFLFSHIPFAAFMVRAYKDKVTGLLDYSFEEFNQRAVTLFTGFDLHSGKSARELWPQIAMQDELWEVTAKLLEGQPSADIELFSGTVGRNFRFRLTWLGQSHILILLEDISEVKQMEAQLFEVSERLRSALLKEKTQAGLVRKDYQEVLLKIADNIEPLMDSLDATPECESAVEFLERLGSLRGEVLSFAGADMLSLKVDLVPLQAITELLISQQAANTPWIQFGCRKLPTMLLAEQVYMSAMKNLLELIGRLRFNGEPTIQIESDSLFLDSRILVKAFSFEYEPIIPSEAFEGDRCNLAASSCIRLAAINRMITGAGGVFNVNKIPHGLQFSFTLAVPLNS